MYTPLSGMEESADGPGDKILRRTAPTWNRTRVASALSQSDTTRPPHRSFVSIFGDLWKGVCCTTGIGRLNGKIGRIRPVYQ